MALNTINRTKPNHYFLIETLNNSSQLGILYVIRTILYLQDADNIDLTHYDFSMAGDLCSDENRSKSGSGKKDNMSERDIISSLLNSIKDDDDVDMMLG